MGRIALVTGGTRGIGEAICIYLKEAGFTVVANYGGNEEKATSFACSACDKSFTPRQAGELRRTAGERLCQT